MAKEFSRVVRICELISKYSLYILIAIVPILFLPITSDVLDFNKQAVMVLLVFLSLFAQMIKILISGKFSFAFNKTHIAIAVFYLIYLISTIFSQDKYGSFWGWPRVTSESFLTLTGFVLIYLVISNLFSKKEIFISLTILLLSSIIATIYGVLQLFGLFIIPLSIAKSAGFNTIGSIGSFGMILTILLPLMTVFIITVSEKWLKIVIGIGLAVALVCLLLINYPLVWWSLLVSSALLIAFGMFKRDSFDLRWLAIPIFFFVLALFFIIIRPIIPSPQKPIEIYLNQLSTVKIAVKTIKERPILGSGPGTFIFEFSKNKEQDFNNGQLWNLRFDSGASKFLTILTNVGVLGALAFLSLIFLVIFYGVIFLIKGIENIKEGKSKNSDKESLALSIITAGVFVAFLAQTVSYFLYSSNFTLDFVYFLLIACFVGLISEKKDYNLSPSSFLTLGVTLIFTLVFIFGLGLSILEGQRYLAEVNFNKGITAYAKGDLNMGLNYFEKAIVQNRDSDVYFTNLSQAYIANVANLVSKKDLSDEEKEKLQVYIANTISSAKIATDLNPNNVSNWSIRGLIYQNLIGLVPGTEDWAIESYDKASALDPLNPYYITQKGIILLTKAYGVDKDSEADKKADLLSAKEQFDKAIKLKSDYASARFQLAMVLQAQGKTDQVMPALQEAKKYAPNDVGLSFQIGLLYYQDKDYKNAQKEFERTITLNENYSNALYFLGLAYSKQGQDSKAIDAIKKVAKLNPDNEEIKKVLDNLNNGKDPLSGIEQETPVQAPVKEESPEETKK